MDEEIGQSPELIIDIGEHSYIGTPPELAVRLRGEPHFMSLRQIASHLDVSYQTIAKWLKREGITGHRFDWLTQDWLLGRSDDEISLKLNVGLDSVPYYRNKFDVPKFDFVNLTARKEYLVKLLFGDAYRPGKKFTNYLREVFDRYLSTDRQKEVMLDYYVLGSVVTRSERPFLTYLRQSLTEVDLGQPERLVHLGILEEV